MTRWERLTAIVGDWLEAREVMMSDEVLDHEMTAPFGIPYDEFLGVGLTMAEPLLDNEDYPMTREDVEVLVTTAFTFGITAGARAILEADE